VALAGRGRGLRPAGCRGQRWPPQRHNHRLAPAGQCIQCGGMVPPPDDDELAGAGRWGGPAPRRLRNVRVLLCTGGPDSPGRVAAQLSTLAAGDPGVWRVAPRPGPTNQMARLPATAEAGGRAGLPRKTLALFSRIAAGIGPQLDAHGFYLKADDDTHLDLPRARMPGAGDGKHYHVKCIKERTSPRTCSRKGGGERPKVDQRRCTICGKATSNMCGWCNKPCHSRVFKGTCWQTHIDRADQTHVDKADQTHIDKACQMPPPPPPPPPRASDRGCKKKDGVGGGRCHYSVTTVKWPRGHVATVPLLGSANPSHTPIDLWERVDAASAAPGARACPGRSPDHCSKL